MRSMKKVILLIILTVSAVANGLGQPFSIDWHKVAGGGGTSTNGQLSLSGTICQHDAGGPLTGGPYSINGGYWAFLGVIQTSNAPTLYITRAGNAVSVYWQAVSGWNLQQNSDLSKPGNWSASSGVTTANGTNYYNLTSP